MSSFLDWQCKFVIFQAVAQMLPAAFSDAWKKWKSAEKLQFICKTLKWFPVIKSSSKWTFCEWIYSKFKQFVTSPTNDFSKHLSLKYRIISEENDANSKIISQ